jgi:hypothetical protein
MGATFGFAITNGASSAKTTTDLGVSGNLFNFKKLDDPTAANYSANPVVAGTRSYEVWLRAKFTGAFNKIDNVQFWQSTAFSPATGLAVKWAPATPSAYVTPVSGTNKAVSAVPTSDPGTANVRCRGGLASGLVASGYTDYVVLQLDTTTAAAAGDTSLATFTINYDES